MANRIGWLTPDTPPANTTCRRLLIPDNVDWIAIVSGCLLELTKSYNFEQYGTATPEQTAAVFMDMFDGFSLDAERECRMVGEIILWPMIDPPSAKWVRLNGGSYLRSDYSDLFALIGTTYGAVDSTHFNVPDARARTIVNRGSPAGLTPREVGQSFGAETHVLTQGELAMHAHSYVQAVTSIGAAITGVPVPSATALLSATSQVGSNTPHNNMQPSFVLNYLIRALP